MDRWALLLSILLLMKTTSSNGQETSVMDPCINCDTEKEVCSYFDDSGNVIECPQISEKKITISRDNKSKNEVDKSNLLAEKKVDSRKPKTVKEDGKNKEPKTQKPELKTSEPSGKNNQQKLLEVPKTTTKEALLKSLNVEKALPAIGTDEGKQMFLQKDLIQSQETWPSATTEQKEKTGVYTVEDTKKNREEASKDQERRHLFGGSSSSSEETRRHMFGGNYGICRILSKQKCRIDARNRTWQQVLSTDNNGNPLSGAKADLLEAARKGSRIKIRTSTYSAEVQNCRIINQDICCQALLHGSYQSWEMFQSNVYWWMINVCTTGNWHIVRYFVGGGYLSQTKTRGTFMWYVFRNNDGSYPEPLLSTDSSGTILSGTNRRVRRAIKDGKSLSVLQNNLSLIPIQNVQLIQTTVSAQHVWSVSQRIAGNHIEFQSNAYWFFNLLTNLGSLDMSRWYLGVHTSRGQTNDVVAMDWFAGDCWIKTFTTSAGLSKPLEKLYLRSKVEAGLPIKVKVGHTYREVDNVMVSGNHISAQIISQLAREDVDTFVSDLNWEFSTLSTRGVVRTYRPLVGSSTLAPEGITNTSMDITWYFDSRKWDLLFHVSDTGTTISGSALAVRNAVEQGADVRVGYRQTGDPGFRFSTADNINFGPSPDLSVQAMRHLRDNNIPGDEFDFGDKLVWSFLLLNTKGFIRKTDWIVGEHVNDGRSTERAEIKFFVNL